MTTAAMLLPALLAGLVQGVTGFGAGVLLMLFYPLLFSVAQSSAMSQCLCTVLCLSVLLRYRRSIRFRHCVLPLVFYFPCYFLALQQAVSMNTDALKPVLGLFLVILSVFLLYGSDRIHIKAGVPSAFVCAALGAVVDAFFGIGGPTLVVYFMAILPDKREYLGTIQCFFFTTSLYGTLMRFWKGQLTPDLLPMLVLAAVALLAGAALGGKVVDKIDTARMKVCVYGFIGVAGLITIAANWESLAALVG